ncbi:MAG: phospholipid carrier-dependent glycosyltransferase [Chloroflexi bacterium]|nr:phospholipid carrier-dependent glycosyltransferase [Chloroflexota bacterium]
MSKIINRRDGPPSPDSFSHANGGKGDQSAGAVPGWNRWAWLILDVLWLAGLALYVIAGYRSVPLHGDEPTLIYMSRDYYHLVQRRDVEPVLYRDEPANPAEQDLRLINGTVGKMAMGLAWDLAGLTVDDLNDQWVWEWSWNDNIALGHMPGERLLHAARLSSALFTVISAWVVFGIARVVAARRLAAWAASLIYVTTPAVLLNGRRAMMDGSMLGFIALTALVGVLIVRQQARGWRGAKLAALYALLGVCGGLAVASKHNAAITVAAVFAAVLVAPLLDARRADDMRSHFDAPHLLRVASASLLVIVTFLALNPAWWSAPLAVPEIVLDKREELITSQEAWFGGYESFSGRLEGLADASFFAAPQYYEVAVWQEYVGDQIADYEDSWLAGRQGGPVWGGLLLIAFAAGLWTLIERWREGPAWVVLIWTALSALALLVLTPMLWQRYYLPLQPALAVVAGIGMGRVILWAAQVVRGPRSKVWRTNDA